MTEGIRREERNWAMLCHLAALAMYVAPPFGHVIGPLVVWLIKREEFPFVDEQGKEALNFQISMTIYFFLAGFMILVVIGIVILPALFVVQIVFIIIAAVKASDGVSYQYPFTIRLIK